MSEREALCECRDVLRRLWEELGPKEHRYLSVEIERDVVSILAERLDPRMDTTSEAGPQPDSKKADTGVEA